MFGYGSPSGLARGPDTSPKSMDEEQQVQGMYMTKYQIDFLIKKLELLEIRFDKEFPSPPRNQKDHAWGVTPRNIS